MVWVVVVGVVYGQVVQENVWFGGECVGDDVVLGVFGIVVLGQVE